MHRSDETERKVGSCVDRQRVRSLTRRFGDDNAFDRYFTQMDRLFSTIHVEVRRWELGYGGMVKGRGEEETGVEREC